MFTKRVFELQAKVLGSHVIPMCVGTDWNAGGAKRWDWTRVVEYHSLGHTIIDVFQENPNFDLNKFNDKIWEYFTQWVGNEGYDYLLQDKPGMTLTGKNEERRDWSAFHTSPRIMSH